MSEPTDFDDDADTFITGDGSVPLLEPDEDDITTPSRTICTRCLRPAKTGGDAARPTFEEMKDNAPDACFRSMSGAWWWCSGRKPFHLTLTG